MLVTCPSSRRRNSMKKTLFFLIVCMSAVAAKAAPAVIDPCGLLSAAELLELAVHPGAIAAPKLKDEGYQRTCSYGDRGAAAGPAPAMLRLTAPGVRQLGLAKKDFLSPDKPLSKPDQHGPTEFRSQTALCTASAKDESEVLACSGLSDRHLIALLLTRPAPQGERAYPAVELQMIDSATARVRSIEAAAAAASPPLAPAPASNAALRALKEQDQAERTSGRYAADPVNGYVRDEERRLAVKEMLRIGSVKTAEDFFNAGLIFQHGDTVEDYRSARAFADMALLLDPGSKDARWLSAASWDRLLIKLGKLQWFGTHQGVVIEETYLSEADRAALGTPPLEVLKTARAARSKQ